MTCKLHLGPDYWETRITGVRIIEVLLSFLGQWRESLTLSIHCSFYKGPIFAFVTQFRGGLSFTCGAAYPVTFLSYLNKSRSRKACTYARTVTAIVVFLIFHFFGYSSNVSHPFSWILNTYPILFFAVWCLPIYLRLTGITITLTISFLLHQNT